MQREISDEDLVRFLDGACEVTESEAIEAAINEDAGLAKRVEALSLDTALLRSAGNLALNAAPAMPELPSTVSDSGSRFAMAGVIAASLLIGVALGGYLNRSDETAGWIEAIAAYQVLYVPETLAVAPQKVEATEAVLGRFASASGIDMRAVREIEGLEFVRTQTLGSNGRPLLQMAFRDSNGVPIALCVTRVADGPKAPKAEIFQGLAGTHWVENGYGFLLIGGTALEAVEGWAEVARAAI